MTVCPGRLALAVRLDFNFESICALPPPANLRHEDHHRVLRALVELRGVRVLPPELGARVVNDRRLQAEADPEVPASAESSRPELFRCFCSRRLARM